MTGTERFLAPFFLFPWLSLFAQEAPRDPAWPASCQLVEIVSANDGAKQKAYFHRSAKPGPQPLVVSLHSWSAGYEQADALLPQILSTDCHYIHPDFRGKNDRPEAAGSDLALSDLDEAIDFALKNANVDPARIHVVGNSGGGYATLLLFQRSRHRLASCAAFVPISDLERWYYESLGRRQKYYRELLLVTRSPDSLRFNGAEARRRSPLFMPTPVSRRRDTKLLIAAGVHDGYTGSVPVTQSIAMFNKLVQDFDGGPANQVPADTTLALVTARTLSQLPKTRFGDRQLIYEKRYRNLRLVIFEGGHEFVLPAALQLVNSP